MSKIKIIPCSENWDTFTPTEIGRFCMACKKEVIDFTNMSGVDIKRYFKKRKGQSICGHYRREQLDTYYIDFPIWERQKKHVFQSKFLLALIVGFGLTLFSCQENDLTEIQAIGQQVIQDFEKKDHSETISLQDSLVTDSVFKTKKTNIDRPKMETERIVSEEMLESVVVIEKSIKKGVDVYGYQDYRHSGIPVEIERPEKTILVKSLFYKVIRIFSKPDFTAKCRLKSKTNHLNIKLKVNYPSYFHIQLNDENGHEVKVLAQNYFEKQKHEIIENVSSLKPGKYSILMIANNHSKTIQFRKKK